MLLRQKFLHFTSRVSYGGIKVILTSKSVDEILWCDDLNETLAALLSHSTVYILSILQIKFGILVKF